MSFPRRGDEQGTETCTIQAEELQGGPKTTASDGDLRGKPREYNVLSLGLKEGPWC